MKRGENINSISRNTSRKHCRHCGNSEQQSKQQKLKFSARFILFAFLILGFSLLMHGCGFDVTDIPDDYGGKEHAEMPLAFTPQTDCSKAKFIDRDLCCEKKISCGSMLRAMWGAENQSCKCVLKGECFAEGEKFESFETTRGKCCEGLKAIRDIAVKETECVYPDCWCYVCARCGDGTCGTGENKCNCADDCGRQTKTIEEEGIEFNEIPGIRYLCASGLEKIHCGEFDTDREECFYETSLCYICSRCGNKVCEEWENICNCRADCK